MMKKNEHADRRFKELCSLVLHRVENIRPVERRRRILQRFGILIVARDGTLTNISSTEWDLIAATKTDLIFVDRARLFGFNISNRKDGKVTVVIDVNRDLKALFKEKLCPELHRIKGQLRDKGQLLPRLLKRKDVDVFQALQILLLSQAGRSKRAIAHEMGMSESQVGERLEVVERLLDALDA